MPSLNPIPLKTIRFTLNGKPIEAQVEARMLLSDFLRQQLGRTDIHVACEHGVCGACTIRFDGRPARSCLMFAVQADGHRVDTVESLATKEGELNDLQRNFRTHHGLQCGFCTPGILMSAEAYLESHPNPSEDEVREMLSGHLCRCTGYVGMVRAILDTAKGRKAPKAAE